MANYDDIFKEKRIDLGFLIKKIRIYWYFFAISLFIMIVLAYFKNSLTPRMYENQTVLYLLKNAEPSASFLKSNSFLQGVTVLNNNSNIENESELVSSFSLIYKTLDDIGLSISYYTYDYLLPGNSPLFGFLKVRKEQYTSSPIKVIFDKTYSQLVQLPFKVEIIDTSKFKISCDANWNMQFNYIENRVTDRVESFSFEKIYRFGEPIQTPYFSFTVVLNRNNISKSERVSYFEFNNLNALTLQVKSLMTVYPKSLNSTLLVISQKGTNYRMVTDFLNQLTTNYIEANVEKKTKNAIRTIQFINNQISKAFDSLAITESTLKKYKAAHNIMDISYQAQQLFEGIEKLENEKTSLETQKRYYEYIKEYFSKDTDPSKLMAPASMNVVDPILSNLITNLISLNNERSNIVSYQHDNSKNFKLSELDVKIQNLKNTILENVNNNLTNLEASLKEIDFRLNEANSKFSGLPKTELNLMGIERKFKINDAIYTYLLQKRSEAQIALASNSPDYEIVDMARNLRGIPIQPNKKINYLLAVFLALSLPIIYFVGTEIFNNKIKEIQDIKKLVKFPVLGHIFHSSYKTAQPIIDMPDSPFTESIRSIRTNLDFMIQNNESQVLLLTSSVSGEGKTFTAINLAQSFALADKKTVLLEFDLRRPKISKQFKISTLLGLSSFLSYKSLFDDIIQKTSIENLDIITAGEIPPNPSELISSGRTLELINLLKDMYDYIIIDSAPIGIISETFHLMKHADINIFVTRQNYTKREALISSITKISANNINKLAVILNDVNIKTSISYYGYDSKYYHREGKQHKKKKKGDNIS